MVMVGQRQLQLHLDCHSCCRHFGSSASSFPVSVLLWRHLEGGACSPVEYKPSDSAVFAFFSDLTVELFYCFWTRGSCHSDHTPVRIYNKVHDIFSQAEEGRRC